MAERADCFSGIALRAGAAALVALCGACSTVSDPAGFGMVTQDKYDFMPCVEIVPQRNALIAREKVLSELAAKAESAPGGVIVGYAAYRSELTQTRAMLVAATRGAQKNNCDLTKK
jgi:hypothetical protein